eukprot:2010792-Amphidinium_carterae.2
MQSKEHVLKDSLLADAAKGGSSKLQTPQCPNLPPAMTPEGKETTVTRSPNSQQFSTKKISTCTKPL